MEDVTYGHCMASLKQAIYDEKTHVLTVNHNSMYNIQGPLQTFLQRTIPGFMIIGIDDKRTVSTYEIRDSQREKIPAGVNLADLINQEIARLAAKRPPSGPLRR